MKKGEVDNLKEKSFQIKALTDEMWQFEGYASTFGNVDREGDIFDKKAFDETIKRQSTYPLLFNHEKNSVIGKLELEIDNKGLFAKGWLNLKDVKAQNIYDLMQMGALHSMSIGFSVKDYEARDITKPFGGWIIKKAELYEVSIVTIPANDKALITNLKSFEDESQDFKTFIKEALREVLQEETKRKELLQKISNNTEVE